MTDENIEYNFSLSECAATTRMVALGVGGMGSNAMENLARAEIPGLELYSINTDLQALANCRGSQPLQIGAKRTGGKGAGGNSEVGRLSATDDLETIRKIIKGAELVFIASGMGGGTGTGASPVIAELCRELGVLNIATVTMPMACEGTKRNDKARVGLEELRSQVDSLLIIENENLLAVMGEEDVSIKQAFLRADEVLVQSVRAIASVINSHGYINLDLADLRNVLKRGDGEAEVDAFIGIGVASGEERAFRAAEAALNNPLLRKIDINGAANLLINVTGSEDLGQREAMQAVKCVIEQAGDLDREIFMGVVTDNSLRESMSVTVIATGIPNGRARVLPLKRVVNTETEDLVEYRSGGDVAPEVVSVDDIAIAAPQVRGSQSAISAIDQVPAAPDGFGYSPLVSKAEWQMPAYLRRRRKNKFDEQTAPHSANRMSECENGVVKKRAKFELSGKGQFRQPLYNQA